MKPLYSTATHRLSFVHEENGQIQRSEATDIQIRASQVKPGLFIFFHEAEGGSESSSLALVINRKNEDLSWLEVRAQGASLESTPIVSFLYDNVWQVHGSTVEDIEVKLQGHCVGANYHAWDCACAWCKDMPPTKIDEQGKYYATWEPAPDVPAPILMVHLLYESDCAWLTEAGARIEEVRAIDPHFHGTLPFSRISLPAGSKLGLQGGWMHFQLPNKIEFEHEVRVEHDVVDGTRSGSARLVQVKQYRWTDSRSPEVVVPALKDGEEHPF